MTPTSREAHLKAFSAAVATVGVVAWNRYDERVLPLLSGELPTGLRKALRAG